MYVWRWGGLPSCQVAIVLRKNARLSSCHMGLSAKEICPGHYSLVPITLIMLRPA